MYVISSLPTDDYAIYKHPCYTFISLENKKN